MPYFNPVPKVKAISLKGKALHDLYEEVRQMDRESCIACGEWVQEGESPHHIDHKAGGDIKENLVTVCNDPECFHYQYHHGSLKRAVQILLRRLIELHRG
jgi:hypothetical protein